MDFRPDLKALPKVDALAAAGELASYPAPVRTRSARRAIERLRGLALQGETPSQEKAIALARQEAEWESHPSLRKAINLSGVVCHTGLGRAPLAKPAIEAIVETAGGYAAVEFDLETGKRGSRQDHVRDLLCELTGAEDAFVVNNAAGAVFLALAALAAGKEVVLSRGQMVEIGGSFRLPDIVRESGCRLIEVGCTNRTHLEDYRRALGPETAAILRCHPSNFEIVGFTNEVRAEELSALAHDHGSILIDDQGSGLIIDTSRYGMKRQPTVLDSLKAGADVVAASGDKLLGGPQAGLLLGNKNALEPIKRHPLARALRVDKLTLAALAATLRLYRDGREADIPTWRYLGRGLDEVLDLTKSIQSSWSGTSQIEQGVTEAGSGAAPGTGVPTWRLGLAVDKPDELLAYLRNQPLPIVGRIEKGNVWLDPRTLEADDLDFVQSCLAGWQS